MKRTLLFSFFVIVFCGSLFSQQVLKPEHLWSMKNVFEVAVSDDGNYVAYTLLVPRDINDGIGYAMRELHVYSLKENKNIPLITGDVNISGITWHPEKNKICYRQNTAETTGAQVFCMNIKSKDINQITGFDRSIRSFKFINDKEILFVAQERTPAVKQELINKGIDIKVFEEELLHLELYIYDIAKQQSKRLVENLTIYDFEISPDGKKIAAAVSVKNHIDYFYMFQRIHIFDIATGDLIKRFDNPGKLETMAWCPRSERLAFQSSSHLHDAVCGSLFVMDVNDKNQSFSDLTNLVEGLELSVIDLTWEDENHIIYAAEESVDIGLTRLDVNNNTRETVLAGGDVVYRRFILSGDKVFLAGNTISHPNELFMFNMSNNDLQKLTNHNSWLEGIELARQEKITYYARDGKDIDGVLVYPLNYEEGKSYPLIVYIHGGPEACVKNGWSTRYATWGQFAAAKDYFVFSPNYRASSGRGVDFTMVGFGDLLGVEYDDVLDGIDHLIKSGKVDKNKVGIGGGSYGGFFAAYSATKHSERFAASVVFVGISNQISKRKSTDIPLEDYYVHWGFWTHENWEKVWNASPIKYVNKSNTPTLILHGEEDTRIPVTQGLELYTGLKLHGQAPVRFILYPGEGHGNAKNINQYDYLIRTLEWFDFYLIDNPGSKELPDKYLDYKINN